MSQETIRRENRTRRHKPQVLSGAGALDISVPTTVWTSSGVGQALTIVDGKYRGQRKRVVHAIVGGGTGTGVITAGSTIHLATTVATITLPATKHVWLELEWNGSAWQVVGHSGCTFT